MRSQGEPGILEFIDDKTTTPKRRQPVPSLLVFIKRGSEKVVGMKIHETPTCQLSRPVAIREVVRGRESHLARIFRLTKCTSRKSNLHCLCYTKNRT